MTKQENQKPRSGLQPNTPNSAPLLRNLALEAQRRGDTWTALAQHLGVSYEQLASWRRGQSDMKNSRRDVHRQAAQYLGLPVAVVLVLAGVVSLGDFEQPGESIEVRLQKDLRELQLDPVLGAFVPTSLATSSPAMKSFVALLYREIVGPCAKSRAGDWLAHWRLAAVRGLVEEEGGLSSNAEILD